MSYIYDYVRTCSFLWSSAWRLGSCPTWKRRLQSQVPRLHAIKHVFVYGCTCKHACAQSMHVYTRIRCVCNVMLAFDHTCRAIAACIVWHWYRYGMHSLHFAIEPVSIVLATCDLFVTYTLFHTPLRSALLTTSTSLPSESTTAMALSEMLRVSMSSKADKAVAVFLHVHVHIGMYTSMGELCSGDVYTYARIHACIHARIGGCPSACMLFPVLNACACIYM